MRNMEHYHFPEFATYIAASNLAFLHIYNLKYCQCEDESVVLKKVILKSIFFELI